MTGIEYTTIMAKILDDLRRAIVESDKTRYRIAQETGVDESALCRLMTGERGVRLDALEKIAECLGMEIVLRPKRTRKGR